MRLLLAGPPTHPPTNSAPSPPSPKQVYIIEANPRASRTVPFVAKAIGHPLAAYASLLMSGKTLAELNFTEVRSCGVLEYNKLPALLCSACLCGWRCNAAAAALKCSSGCTESESGKHQLMPSNHQLPPPHHRCVCRSPS